MIGIDVGGANVKVVDDFGVHIHYCPLWKESNLAEILSEYSGEDAAVVMSGELADGFFNKAEGISFIVNSVRKNFPDAIFYGTDGRFHNDACPKLAAANWLASADYLRGEFPNGMLLDIGSTTADIIPLTDFEILKGLTDTLRLQKGFLVYTGILRTPVAALANSAFINGVSTPFSTEYFACSGDAHFVLGNISEAEYTSATPDGKEVSYDACLRRLARSVCADLEEIGEAGAIFIAESFWAAQKKLVCDAVCLAAENYSVEKIFVGGIGSKIFASLVGGVDLSCAVKIPADALPAYAVKMLAEKRL